MIPLDGHFKSMTTIIPFAAIVFILFSYWRFRRAVKVSIIGCLEDYG